MVLALLPHWRERQFGHVVNVSSAGVQASSPKYSAYVPSKAALDAFAEVVGAETLSDHITFTTIHMPLVETPMIAPSRRLNPMPPISAEHAAAMVVRGLVDKPARIDTPVGTLSDLGMYFTPKLSRRVLHQLYLGYPDSAAARGVTDSSPDKETRRPQCAGPSVRRGPGPRSGFPARSSGRCGWCPACTGERGASAGLPRRRYRRRRRDGPGVPVRKRRRRHRRDRFHRGKCSCTTGLPEQPGTAGTVRRHRRAGLEGLRYAAERATAHGGGHSRAAGARLCPAACADHGAHHLRRCRGVGAGSARASRRVGRHRHRTAHQSGAGITRRAHSAPAAEATGDHGRGVRLPREHHTGRGMEHQRRPGIRSGGVRSVQRCVRSCQSCWG